MKKGILIISLFGVTFFFFYMKKNDSYLQMEVSHNTLKDEIKPNIYSSESKTRNPDYSTKETPKKAFTSDLKPSQDVDFFAKLENLSSDADESELTSALVDIARNSTDIDKAIIVISQYGLRGYTAMSLLLDRTAAQEPERAKTFVSKILEEFKSLPSTDPQARMAVCGSLANLSNIDVSDTVYKAIEDEKDPVKRRCLFGIFTSNQNFPKEFTYKLISKAQSDDDVFIQKIGAIWKKNNTILSFEEMQPYYIQIMKELQ